MAVLSVPVVRLQERIRTLSCVVVGIASIRWRRDRLKPWRKRKQYKGQHDGEETAALKESSS